MLKEGYRYYFNLLRNIFSIFIHNTRNFGIKISLFNFLGDLSLFYVIKEYRISIFLREKQHEYIYNFLINQYSSLIDEYKSKKCNSGVNSKKIWCFWWQGIKNAPVLVKKCFKSIKYYSGDYELILIDKNNYGDYVNLPDDIIKKLENGTITITHFSDILRAKLLSQYGGVWTDATMFFCESVFKEFDNTIFNTTSVGNGKWCGFFMGGESNKLFLFLADFLIKYNLDYDSLIAYFLIDYVIEIAYDFFDECKEYIDNATLRNPELFYFEKNFSQKYVSNEFKRICDENKFFKLSYKVSYDEYNEGNLTNYGYFLKN